MTWRLPRHRKCQDYLPNPDSGVGLRIPPENAELLSTLGSFVAIWSVLTGTSTILVDVPEGTLLADCGVVCSGLDIVSAFRVVSFAILTTLLASLANSPLFVKLMIPEL